MVWPAQLAPGSPLLPFFGTQQVTPEGILVYSVVRATFPFEMFSSEWPRFTFISMGSSASSTERNKEGLKFAKSSLTLVR